MKYILFLALVASATAAVHRIRRQSESSSNFWWVNLEENSEIGNAETGNTEGITDAGPSNTASPAEDNTRDGSGGVKPAPSDFGTNPGDAFNSGSGGATGVETDAVVGCDGFGTACVPYYQCDGGNVITDGNGLIDIRVGETVIRPHSACPRYLEVCCNLPDSPFTPDTPSVPHIPGCGHRNTQGIHARIGGLNDTQTQVGEYPWMVAVLRIENIAEKEVNLYQCGGSLLQPNIVLTAAHCVSNLGAATLKIRAGEWDTQSDYELYPHDDRIVKQVIAHPDYDPGSLWNDFAILILDTPLVLSPNIDTICLPTANENFDNVTCVATGWGKDKFGKEGRYQNILKQVSVDVVPHYDCGEALRSTRLGVHFRLDSSFMCAGGKKGVDTCKGDGGSPLVCTRPGAFDRDEIYYQVGIVAWGIGCGENGIPGVYADVTTAVHWIVESLTPYLL